MNNFDPEILVEAVVNTFDYSKVPHTFTEEDTKDYTRALLLEAIHTAMEQTGEFVSVSVDEWVAHALQDSDDNVLASLIYAVESAEAVYKEGTYV